MNLQQRTLDLIEKHHIRPNPLKDQYFIVDEQVLKKVVDLANIRSDEVVLEIGCGLGTLTSELAKAAKEVHGIEVDKQFIPRLNQVRAAYPNVCIIFGDAWKILGGSHRPEEKFDKIVSNLPYSLCEPMMHKFSHSLFKVIIFMVPERFARKVIKHPIFTAYYDIKKKLEVPKNAFYPIPETDSAVLKITRKKDPLEVSEIERFIRQFIYEHEDALLKNSLREAVVQSVARIYDKKLTKNEAREVVSRLSIGQDVLERKGRYTDFDVYNRVAEELERIIRDLY